MASHVPLDISALFFLIVVFLDGWIIAAVARATLNLGRTPEEGRAQFSRIHNALLGWLVLTAGLAIMGFLLDFDGLPPRFLVVLLPALAGVAWVARSSFGGMLIAGLSPAWFIMPQVFRLPLEFALWRLHAEGIIPVQMTFEGQNFDILTGLTAPLVAWLCFSRRVLPAWVAVAWNLLGLALVFNIMAVSILSTPTPLRQFMNDPANTIIAYWPFVWLPAFVVPMALALHALSLRQLLGRKVAP